jgi:hypothetical protein
MGLGFFVNLKNLIVDLELHITPAAESGNVVEGFASLCASLLSYLRKGLSIP